MQVPDTMMRQPEIPRYQGMAPPRFDSQTGPAAPSPLSSEEPDAVLQGISDAATPEPFQSGPPNNAPDGATDSPDIPRAPSEIDTAGEQKNKLKATPSGWDSAVTRALARRSAPLAPDAAADVIALARRVGAPPDLVARNQTWFQRLDAARRTDDVLNQAPVLRGVYNSGPLMADMLRDDLDNAAGLEKLLADYRPPLSRSFSVSPSPAAPTRPESAATPPGGPRRVPGYRLSSLERLSAAGMEGLLGLVDSSLSFLSGLSNTYTPDADTLEQYLPGQGQQALDNLKKGLERQPLAGGLERVAQGFHRHLRENSLPPTDDPVQNFLEDVVRMGPQVLAQGAAYAAGGFVPAALFTGAQIAGGKYAMLTEEQAQDKARAFLAALADAGLQTPLETLSTGRLLNILSSSGLGNAFKAGAKAVSTEFLTEWAQAYPETLTTLWAKAEHEGRDTGETLRLFFDTLGETTRQGMYEGLVASVYGGLGGAGKMVHEYGRYRAGKTDGDFFAALDDSARTSKTRRRLPQEYQSLVESLTADGPVTDVLVDPQALRRAVGDENAFRRLAQDLELSEDALSRAEALGTDLKIPLSLYQTHIAGADFSRKLRAGVRFRPGDMNLAERLRFERDAPAQLTDALQRLEADARRNAELDAALAPAAEQLETLYGREAANANLALLKARARVAADWWSQAGEPLAPAQIVTEKWGLRLEIADGNESVNDRDLWHAAILDAADPRITWRSDTKDVTVRGIAVPPITKEGRKKAIAALKAFQGQSLPTKYGEVRISRDGIGENTRARTDEHFATLPYLREILDNAEWFREEPNTAGKGGKVLHALAPVLVGEKPFAAHVVFKQAMERGVPFWKYYGHSLLGIKKKDVNGAHGSWAVAGRHHTTSTSFDINLYELIDAVNQSGKATSLETKASRLPADITILRQSAPHALNGDARRPEPTTPVRERPEATGKETERDDTLYQAAERSIYSDDRSVKMTFKETGVDPSFEDRAQLRAYLQSLDAEEVRRLKLKDNQSYFAVLKSIVRRFFPTEGGLRFRKEGRALDYGHFAGRDSARDAYLGTLLSTLKNEDIRVEFTTEEGQAKAYLIKKYLDAETQKDVWDMLVVRDNELKTKIARDRAKGRNYVESQILRSADEASRPDTAGGATESASTPRDEYAESIVPSEDQGKTLLPSAVPAPLSTAARNLDARRPEPTTPVRERHNARGDGLFQKRAPVEVDGNELGVPDGADLKEYIKAAKSFHDALKYESEHGNPVYQPQLERPVRFSSKGWRENVHSGANPDKWKLFSSLRKIIENSELMESVEPYKKRPDGFQCFHWAEATVELDGVVRRVGFTLAEDEKGNLFYNLNADPAEIWQKERARNVSRHFKGGGHGLNQNASAPVADNIRPADDGVNLHILDDATPSGPRGSIVFTDAGTVIRLFRDSADLSSFAHEAGHLFMRDMQALTDTGNAPQHVLDDMRRLHAFVAEFAHAPALKKYYDLEYRRSRDGFARKDFDSLTEAEKSHVRYVAEQEKLADAFLTYLREGRAPSPELRGAFRRFKDWLKNLYQSLMGTVRINDDVRGVFDRMLAADADMTLAEELHALDARNAAALDAVTRETLSPAEQADLARLRVEASARSRERRLAAADTPEAEAAIRRTKALDTPTPGEKDYYNAARLDALLLELRALERKAAHKGTRAFAAGDAGRLRRWARNFLEAAPASPNLGGYAAAEARAAVETVHALKDDRIFAALAAKRRQVLNHALALDALTPRDARQEDTPPARDPLFQPSREEIDAAEAALQRDADAWGKAVDAFTQGTLPSRKPVTMLNQTPLVLALLGADKNVKVATSYAVLKKVLVDKHKLPENTVKQIPAAMADPVMVFDSATVGGDLVMMLDLKDENGATVVVPIALKQESGHGDYTVNVVTSMYAKKDINTNKARDAWFLHQMQNDNLRYINNKKSRAWLRASGLQLPGGLTKHGKNRIFTDADLVKLRQANPGLYQPVMAETPDAPEQTSVGRVKGHHFQPSREEVDAADAALRRDATVWEKTVDDVYATLADTGKLPSGPVKMLGQTPLVLRMLGEDALTGTIASGNGIYAAPHFFDATHPNITPDMRKQIPAAMADPIAVFDSSQDAGREKGDVVFMLDLKDDNGATVVVPVALHVKHKDRVELNLAKSVYAKDRNGKPDNAWFAKQLQKNARYVNGQKTERWRLRAGGESPIGSPANASGNRIFTDADLVKLRQANPGLYQR